MKPKLTLLLLAFSGLASSAYILIKSKNEKIACQKKCNCKKPPAVEESGGSDALFEPSFNHMIVSTIK